MKKLFGAFEILILNLQTLLKTFYIFFLTFYISGTLFLPLGNFSALQNLTEIYKHCKTTEDKDMTVLDFVTDHLLNIDGVFDKHINGDEQKPHSPIPCHHSTQIMIFRGALVFIVELKQYTRQKKNFRVLSDNFFTSEYISEIFRPPIFA